MGNTDINLEAKARKISEINTENHNISNFIVKLTEIVDYPGRNLFFTLKGISFPDIYTNKALNKVNIAKMLKEMSLQQLELNKQELKNLIK